MSEPPYPPQGGSEPEGPREWHRPPDDADETTEQFGAPWGFQREQTREFGQPPYGQPQYGQPQYGQPAYGPPPYGPPQYGPHPYGPPQYGQSPYGSPQYGPPGAPWGPPGGPVGQPPKRGRNTLLSLIIAGVVVLAAIGVALYLVLGRHSTSAAGPTANATSGATPPASGPTSSDGASGVPPAGEPPDGLGDDPVLNQFARSCYDGDMAACDRLYNDSEVGSGYETYGGTCAGRQPISNSDVVYCTDAFPS